MKTIITGIAIFAIAIGFNIWLDSGCKMNGALTLHGKICYEDILNENQ